jgi:nicotinate-nucleotide adenylyltransferase
MSSTNTKKIGIYSGVFDPVHHGHISFAKKAMQELGLDKVYFMVEPKPWRKTKHSSARHRLNMMWLALRDHANMELLELKHDTFSVAETLPELEKKFKDAELHMLMGTDLFNSLHTWAGFEVLRSKVKFVVGQRAGQSSEGIQIDHQSIQTGLAHLNSTAIRANRSEQLAVAVPETVSQYITAEDLYSN